jgi:hypothetical protein
VTVSAVVANPAPSAVTAGLNTVEGHSVQLVQLAAGDADGFLTAGCALGPPLTGAATTPQEAVFMLHRNPTAVS